MRGWIAGGLVAFAIGSSGGIACGGDDDDGMQPNASADGGDEAGTHDNVAACEELIDAFECGTADLSMAIDCSVYGGLQCDVADYFDCVADHVSCNGGTLDISQITQCAELATCG